MPKESEEKREIRKVERYEYLLVEYLKEISNEMTYLVLITCAIFLFLSLDVMMQLGIAPQELFKNEALVKIVFVVIICSGFGLFALSNLTKRRIEKQFERIL